MSNLVKRLRCWCETDQQEHKLVNEAADEIESQCKILDKLPKCWRFVAGKLVQDCPVVPGGTYYVHDNLEPREFSADSFCRDDDGWYFPTNCGCVSIQDCANSPEAAKALAEAQTKG